MKKLQIWMIAAVMMLCMGGLTACGNNTGTENAATENRETAAQSETAAGNPMGGLEGETDGNGNLITAATETDGTVNDGGVIGYVADDIGDAGKEVIDGAENAVDDITGNGAVSEENTAEIP